MARRKIRKAPKVANLASKFHHTVNQSTRFRAEGPDPEPYEQEMRRGAYRQSGQDISEREAYNIARAQWQERVQQRPEEAAKQGAYLQERSRRYVPSDVPGPAVAELDEEWIQPRVSSQDAAMARKAGREHTWQSASGVYRVRPQEKKSSGSFIKEELPPSHREWVNKQLQDPNSEFNRGLPPERIKTGKYTSGQRRRLQRYTDALQQGETHQEALDRVRRTRLRTGVGRPTMTQARSQQAQKVIGRRKPAGREVQSRFRSLAPTPAQFTFGIDASSRPGLDRIKKQFPDASEQEWLQIQQAGTELMAEELLLNQRWGHETRRAKLLGQQSGKVKDTSDKVTIFTTNVGHPAVSVPADSLVGQYIIRKRKSVLGSFGVPSRDLRGKYPDAVRDQHIIDVATGVSLGLQGRAGVVNSTGYRFNKRASSGYGRPRPLGASVLYDSSTGRPLYDSQGNIRYSEGATRPVDWSTPNIGARILIG